MKGVFKWGFVGDLQQPYDDKRAVALFLKVMKHWEPDAVDVVGDIADFVSGVADLWWVRFESNYSGSDLRNKKCIETL